MSNRFAGPVYRIRLALQQLADGETPDPIQFRENDYWRDLATYVNSITRRIQETEEALAAAERDRDPSPSDEPNDFVEA